tara:strand:+ start:464 stop:658 length:195 start_codon:yes stop_codon:yes gene_type:complete
MLEFLFGWLLGVWSAQQFNLPSVQTAIKTWWNSKPDVTADTLDVTEEDHETTPIFTGDMPPAEN